MQKSIILAALHFHATKPLKGPNEALAGIAAYHTAVDLLYLTAVLYAS
jgi:hypothetical protein